MPEPTTTTPTTTPTMKTKVEIDTSKYITNMRRARFWLPRTAQWLRKVSELVNGAKFDLNVWGEVGVGLSEAFSRPMSIPSSAKEASNCGFQGCALGWSALEPRHRKAGLRLEKDYGQRLSVTFEQDRDTFAACSFYGISYSAARAIFGHSKADWRDGKISETSFVNLVNQHDPIAAAERIERFCNDMGIPLLEPS